VRCREGRAEEDRFNAKFPDRCKEEDRFNAKFPDRCKDEDHFNARLRDSCRETQDEEEDIGGTIHSREM
jgi:hypothetical protein